MTQLRYILTIYLLSVVLVGNVISKDHQSIARENVYVDPATTTPVHQGAVPAHRTYLGDKAKAEKIAREKKTEEVAVAKKSVNPLHAARTQEGGSGALLTRHNRGHAAGTTSETKARGEEAGEEVKPEKIQTPSVGAAKAKYAAERTSSDGTVDADKVKHTKADGKGSGHASVEAVKESKTEKIQTPTVHAVKAKNAAERTSSDGTVDADKVKHTKVDGTSSGGLRHSSVEAVKETKTGKVETPSVHAVKAKYTPERTSSGHTVAAKAKDSNVDDVDAVKESKVGKVEAPSVDVAKATDGTSSGELGHSGEEAVKESKVGKVEAPSADVAKAKDGTSSGGLENSDVEAVKESKVGKVEAPSADVAKAKAGSSSGGLGHSGVEAVKESKVGKVETPSVHAVKAKYTPERTSSGHTVAAKAKDANVDGTSLGGLGHSGVEALKESKVGKVETPSVAVAKAKNTAEGSTTVKSTKVDPPSLGGLGNSGVEAVKESKVEKVETHSVKVVMAKHTEESTSTGDTVNTAKVKDTKAERASSGDLEQSSVEAVKESKMEKVEATTMDAGKAKYTAEQTSLSGTVEVVKVKDSTADHTSSAGTNTKGVHHGAIGRHGDTERVIHRNNKDDHKQLRGLKAREGVGSLQVKNNAIKTGKKESAAASPLACKERLGKKCKHAAVEQKAGEARGPRLTVEGTEEQPIQPGFSLISETSEATTEVPSELSASALAWLQQQAGTVDDTSKRFYEYPTITNGGSNIAAPDTSLVEVDATGATIDENYDKTKNSNEQQTKEPEFVTRAIPNRFSGFRSTTTNRNFEGAQSSAGYTQVSVRQEGQESNTGAETKQPAWATDYYKHTQTETNTFFGHAPTITLGSTGSSNNAASSSEASSTTSGNSFTAPPTLGSAGSGQNVAGETTSHPGSNAPGHSILAPPVLAETDSNADDGSSGSVVASGVVDLNSYAQSSAGQSDGAVTFFQHSGTAGTGSSASGATGEPALDTTSFFDDEDGGEDDDSNNDDDDDGIDTIFATAIPSESEPYLSSFGSSSIAPITSLQQATPTPTPTPSVTPTVTSTETPKEEETTLEGIESNANVTAGASPILSEVVNGITYYTDSVAASPVFVEASGSTDLTQHKEEVFQSLEPLLSRHFESMFGENFLEEYQLTITYVQTEDSILQLRRGSEAKTYVTELIVLVVFHVRTQVKEDIAVFTDTVATAAVQAFFDPANVGITTFLQALSSKGIFIRDFHAQGQPHPPRNHAMEHGISHITPSNGSEESGRNGISNPQVKIAVIVAVVGVLSIVVAVIAVICYRRRQNLAIPGRAMLDAASDFTSEYGSRARNSIEAIKSRIQSRSLTFGRRRRNASSVRSDDTSTLSYIQPAAIQLRRKRGIAVPQDDTPLPGRQDDYHFDNPEKPSSIYDIDVDDDADFKGTRRMVGQSELASLPDDGDYDTESSEDDTFVSRQSKLSLDRISIARSAMEVEESHNVKQEKVSKKELRYEREKHARQGSSKNDHIASAGEADVVVNRYNRGGARSSMKESSALNNEKETNRLPPSKMPVATSTSTYRRDSDNYLRNQTAFAPLSPLSSLLAEAMGDTPNTVTHDEPNRSSSSSRRGVDPPPSYSYATDYSYSSATYMSPPASMQDIMPDEYLNKKRWQDEEADTMADLPDHVSTNMSTYSVATRASDAESYISGFTAERDLVEYDAQTQTSRTPYKKQRPGRQARQRMSSSLAEFNLS